MVTVKAIKNNPTRLIKSILIGVMLFFLLGVHAQTDTEFWFVAPDVTSEHNSGGGQPSFINVTTKNLPSTVTVSMPANPLFTPITIDVPANSTQRINLSANMAEYKQIANLYTTYGGVQGKNNRGFYIESSALITAYFEYANTNNPDIWALKGDNALGKEFYTSFQTDLYNRFFSSDPAYSAIDLVATEDNTTVTITTQKDILGYEGLNTFDVVLNTGETFSMVPAMVTEPEDGWDANDQIGRAGNDHLAGVHIASDKKIAVSLKDDSMKSFRGGCYDLAGDQTIPLEVAGKEYIAMLGQLDVGSPNRGGYPQTGPGYSITDTDSIQERLYITGTEYGDSIFINGEFYSTLNRYQTVTYPMLPDNEFVNIKTNHKSYVLQHTGFGCEFGQAILPPVDKCTGSTEVGFTRSETYSFYLNIMVRKGAEDAFRVFSDGVEIPGLINAADFDTIPGNNNWLALRTDNIDNNIITKGKQTFISNSKDVFHLGTINGEQDDGGVRFGYFSNFNEFKISTFSPDKKNAKDARICYGENLQLVATGGLNVHWTPEDYLDDPYSLTPIAEPPHDILYVARVQGMCNMVDSSEISIQVSYPFHTQLTTDKVIGCSPMSVEINEKAGGYMGKRWNYGTGTKEYKYADTDTTTLDTSFSLIFRNFSDTIRRQKLTLMAYNLNQCWDTITRTLHIKPQINAGFTTPDTIGCHPFHASFQNTSSGDTSIFNWDFGDGAGDYGTNIGHTFLNFGSEDTNFLVTMEAISPFLCRDTAEQWVTIHPYLDANFSIDSTSGCAPLSFSIKNKSIAVDTFYWEIVDTTRNQVDTLITSTTKNDYQFILDNPETFPLVKRIRLTGKNKENCTDSTLRYITIFPGVEADFEMSEPAVCDSVLVSFNNLSRGHNLSFFWNFGDNNTSTEEHPVNRFLNKNDDALTRDITLRVENEYNCQHDSTQELYVYPYIKARVGLDTATGCHPFTLLVNNQSVGADNYSWDFGDGSANWDTTSSQFRYRYTNHSFDTTATFPFELVVGNRFGCKDTLNSPITVFPNIQSGFVADRYRSCAPALFHFTSTSQGAASYYWDFQDGSSSVKKDSISHHFPINNTAAPITYAVSLHVRSDNDNCHAVYDTNIVVDPYVRSDFSIEEHAACPPFVAAFENNSIGQANTYRWYINNKLENTSTHLASTFYNPLTNPRDSLINIRLFASNTFGCTSEFIDTITVYALVEADFDVSTAWENCHPFSQIYLNQSTNATRHKWDFGDGASSHQSNPQHLLQNFSNQDTTYHIKLISESDHCVDSITQDVTVFTLPKTSFEVSTFSGCSPLSVTLLNNTEAAHLFAWDFGDSQSDTTYDNQSVNHLFRNQATSNPGEDPVHERIIQLTASNDHCEASLSRQVQVYPEVLSSFSALDTADCNPLTVPFLNKSKNAHYFHWSFGDQMTSGVREPKHFFFNFETTDTTYTTRLVAESKFGCMDTSYQRLTVHPAPIAEFSATPSHQYYPGATITINNQTQHNQGPWNYHWDFDDDNTSSDKEPGTYEFDTWDTFDIQLTSWSDHCRDSVIRRIIVHPPVPIPDFTTSLDSGCVPLTVQFTSLSLYGDEYEWDFDNGIKHSGETTTFTFYEARIYNVKLTVSGPGGRKFTYKQIDAYPLPEVDYTFAPDTAMLPDQYVKFFNRTEGAIRYLWEFGDGNTSTRQNPEHLYGPPPDTTYPLKLTAWSDRGCMASDSLYNTLFIRGKGLIRYPNVFLPSLSGSSGGYYNDLTPDSDAVFRPFSEGVVEYHLQIFNRWGELIFESKDVEIGWDGYHKGQVCSQGVYVYKVSGKYANGKPFIQTGDVTLLLKQ